MNYVFSFGDGKAEGFALMKALLGGKGALLHEMTLLQLPVPAGFTLSSEVCVKYANERVFPTNFEDSIQAAIVKIEQSTQRKFAGNVRPLLLSVRSGARVSMPGMMDTILNLGLNDELVDVLAKETSVRFAYDCYRRLIQMYADVVYGVGASGDESDPFQSELSRLRQVAGVERDDQLDAESLKQCVASFKTIIMQRAHVEFPQDAYVQLVEAIKAVFASWNNARAIHYRKLNRIPNEWGTACTVQAMVYGNYNERSATGVAFTRDPATGERRFFGEYLCNAQGEDVVSGVRTPQPINAASIRTTASITMQSLFPRAYAELDRIQVLLEAHFHDMQDIEFTVQDDRLFMLQCRSGKRTPLAAFRMAYDMQCEKLIDAETAVMRLDADGVTQFLAPVFDVAQLGDAVSLCVISEGCVCVCVCGCVCVCVCALIVCFWRRQKQVVSWREDCLQDLAQHAALWYVDCAQVLSSLISCQVFDSLRAKEVASSGRTVVLVRHETSPEDIVGMHSAQVRACAYTNVVFVMTRHCRAF
jgi:pyruvate,orthophosphate dikinase